MPNNRSAARSARMESALQCSAGRKKITKTKKNSFGVSSKCKCNDWATRLVCTSDCVSTQQRVAGKPRPEWVGVGHSGNCCHYLLANRTRLVMRITAASCHLHMTSIISWWSRCGAINRLQSLHSGEVVIITRAIWLQLADKCRSIIISATGWMPNVKAHPSISSSCSSSCHHLPYSYFLQSAAMAACCCCCWAQCDHVITGGGMWNVCLHDSHYADNHAGSSCWTCEGKLRSIMR